VIEVCDWHLRWLTHHLVIDNRIAKQASAEWASFRETVSANQELQGNIRKVPSKIPVT